MSTLNTFLQMAEGWRQGALEIRNEEKHRIGRVSEKTEVGATVLESCANRIERVVQALVEREKEKATAAAPEVHPS